jgi:hypothetical protein
MSNRIRGVIIPTALFVAQIVLLLVTFLVASVSYNLHLSLGSVESTEFRYISFAAANELISDLNWDITVSDQTTAPPLRDGELTYETYTKDDPRRVKVEGRVTESWVEPMDDQGEKVVVVAQTYRQSRNNAQVVRMLTRFKTNTNARVYANSLDSDKTSPDPIYYSDGSDSGAWSQLPDIPKVMYGDDGILREVEGEFAGSIPYVSGSPDGSVYALYAPVLDGWKDKKATVFVLPLNLGDFTLKTITNGSHQGLTIGDLQPIAQVLIDYTSEITIAKGAAMMKYDHDSDAWKALPPTEEVSLVNGEFVSDPGNFYPQGVSGPPAGFEGGMVGPMYRKGQDAIYRYADEANNWEVIKPPGQDIMLLAADQTGTTYVQTGDLQTVGIGYLLDILLGNLGNIYANTSTSAMHKYEDGTWTPIPDPPAKFYDKSGNLVDDPYPGARGPTLGGMVGGEAGEITVVNRPKGYGLVDTVYKFKDGAWQVVPSPRNSYYDSSGNEIEESGLPDRLEVGVGSEGEVILRVPTTKGSDSVFIERQIDGEYDVLPPVQGDDGSYVQFLSQMSAGKKRDGSNKGRFRVNATYF